jgi:HlyD family secretion protein
MTMALLLNLARRLLIAFVRLSPHAENAHFASPLRSPMSSQNKWPRGILIGVAVVAIVLGGSYGLLRGRLATGAPPDLLFPEDPPTDETQTSAAIPVEVVVPRAGGLERICLQPGSVEPYEAADLYSKVSGYLLEQHVDIGARVRAGDVLARLSVPEYEKQVKQDRAEVVRARAHVDQMLAAITTAKADLGAATAGIALAATEKKTKVSYRVLREKQRDRIKYLVDRQALESKLGDEQEDQLQAAISADLAATESVNAARQKVAAARARVQQAEADLQYSKTEVASAEAHLERAQVLLDYTIIRSPYTGVITKRNFFPGDFIRSADSGGERVPLLAVERTDVMRVIVQVPERDVPFVDCGDPAIVEVDALPGLVFKTRGADKVEVSRLAASEDPSVRMMRTEVHVKNPGGKLRRGMFGRVTLILEQGAPNSFRIPSSALTGKADGGKGFVRVVRADKVSIIPVRYGADNGTEVEILAGLQAGEHIIVRAAGPISEGTQVVEPEAQAKGP